MTSLTHQQIKEYCGWTPDDSKIRRYAGKVGTLQSVGTLSVSSDQSQIELWRPLLEFKPNWRRGAQGIGDCVSWGAELAATFLLAIQAKLGVSSFTDEAATESIYGGCRVEALGKSTGGWQDGAFGAAAADFLHRWGVLLRQDYSQITGNPEHDLRKYIADKAKQWGNWGCGGRDDRGKLDDVARKFPVRGVAQVKTVDEMVAALQNGYPITIASMAGFGRMVRDSSGVCRRRGRWAHQMAIGGLRWERGLPQGRIFQSWGHSCSGPDPDITDEAVSACSWWSTEEDLAWIFRSGDCWVLSDLDGFPPRKLDFSSKSWG